MSKIDGAGTQVAALVRPFEDGAPAVEIADGVFMSGDISNSYAVGSAEGALVINTGTRAGGPKHRARYKDAGLDRVAAVVLTQHHTDHVGGLQAFLAEQPKLIADWRFPEGFKYHTELQPYYMPRWNRIWGLALGANMPPPTEFAIHPDILIEGEGTFTLGAREFLFFSVPGGETLDSLCVWLPKEKIVFTGNLFGPAFMTVPNVNTLRIDKPRSIIEYIRCIDRVRALGADMLVTGHGEPVAGAARVAADLARLRNAVQYIHDETVVRMNAGESVEQAMRDIALPPELQIHEGYGTVAWTVKTVWTEYSGWWDQRFTSELYPVALSDRYPELVALAGADRLAANARVHIDAGRFAEGLQLAEILLTADEKSKLANEVRIRALQGLLALAPARSNFQETVWLRAEIARAEAHLAAAPGNNAAPQVRA